ncbi:MAG TPA: class I SAM-dependent RNA methyltransferase [Ktedonobacterales bacterium]
MADPGPTNPNARTADRIETTATPASRPTIAGRYRVRVETLEPTGEARGTVLAALAVPSAEELAQVYGARPIEPVERVSFIGGLPGEVVEVELRWSLPRPGRKPSRRVPPPLVRVVAVIEAAPERATPGCPVFGECGGCQLQQLAYEAQLAWKAERVRAALSRAGLSEPPVAPTIGCAPPWGYRNQMRFSINRAGQPGLTARGSRRILPLTNCPIAHPRINDALALLAEEPQPPPQVVLRYGAGTGDLLMQPPPTEATRARLAAAGLDPYTDSFEEVMGGARFRIRPSSFFQTNTAQANQMAALVLERLPSGPDVTLVDAYCGVGTFARLLAARAGHVIAIEESASAIRDAQWNLREMPNVEIVQAKVEEILPQMARRLDGLVIDPPRAGCQRPVLDALAERRVPRVVYVSCDPDTLARDLTYLCVERGVYRLASVQPLDMFPQTAHIENIATLEAC